MSTMEMQEVVDTPPRTGREQNLGRILTSVRAGNCCRVLGPRYRAKSSLVRQAAAILRQDGTHYVAYQSLHDLPWISEEGYFASLYTDVLLVSESDFFTGLYAEIERHLLPHQALTGQGQPHSALEFQNDLLRLLRCSDRNLALFIDDLEMAPPNLVASLLGVLQAVYMIVVDQPGPRFQIVICGSLSLSQIALDSASHFESISDLVLVGDLDEIERQALAQNLCQEAGVTPAASWATALLFQTDGDHYLIKRICQICFEQMNLAGRTALTPARVAEAVEIFLSRDADQVVVETLRQIQSDPNLLSCALQILEQGEVLSAHLPIASNETPTSLDLCGVFSQENGRYRVKCPLWERLLQRHLAAAHIGSLYAIAGRWHEAIRYLGQAICEGQLEVMPELFTVVINAINGSEDAGQAFHYLGQGLQAAYPDSTLYLYRRSDSALEPVYLPQAGEQHLPIPLTDMHRPEIEALRGPDYSLAAISQEKYLLIPLRIGSVNTRPIGLVSLGGLLGLYSPYQQRDELLQLIGFLRQAARAILQAALHDEDERRRRLLERVSTMTPVISASLKLDDVFRAVLSQVQQAIPRAQNVCIVQLDEEAQELTILPVSLAFYQVDELPTGEAYMVGVAERLGVAGRVIRAGRSSLVTDVNLDPDYIASISSTRSELCVPIKINGKAQRALVLESDQPDAFTADDQRLLEMLADHVGIAIRNAEQFQLAHERQFMERTAVMATGLIHDINSAVASIPDLVEEIRWKLAAGKETAGPLADLQNSALVTEKVGNKLKNFVVTRQYDPRPVDLESVIKDALQISEKYQPPHVKTTYTMNGLQLKLVVDALWIELLLKNLLVNAYDAIPPDRKGLVKIEVDLERDTVFIHVRDNGKGIPAEVLNNIFEFGFTTKGGNRMQGVGLYYCQQIAETHQGRLEVYTEPGKGSVFSLSLPTLGTLVT